MDIDYRIECAARIETGDRLMDTVRTGRLVRIGHDRAAPSNFDRICNRPIAAGDDDRPDLSGDRAAPDMDDHRHPADLGERFAGQARRGEPGGDHDDRVLWRGFSHGGSSLPIG